MRAVTSRAALIRTPAPGANDTTASPRAPQVVQVPQPAANLAPIANRRYACLAPMAVMLAVIVSCEVAALALSWLQANTAGPKAWSSPNRGAARSYGPSHVSAFW